MPTYMFTRPGGPTTRTLTTELEIPMSARSRDLHATADHQIAELIERLDGTDEATLRAPCPGREKLGDGTIGALVAHTADNYLRIAMFVTGGDQAEPRQHGHENAYSADELSIASTIKRLSDARRALALIGDLSTDQLASIPAKDSFRFCDGERTLEQVLAGLLRHQSHQLEVLRAALA
jgi:DinB superfamily